MANKFDPTVPSTESRILSEPVRNNFLALNARNDQLTVSASSPVSTSVIVGKADKTYFENNTFVPFAGVTVDLGSSTTGVSSFNNPGTYKEVILFYRNDSILGGVIEFVEGQEKSIREHSPDTAAVIINDINEQRQADAYGASSSVPGLISDISPLDNTIILCSILVTNSGIVSQRGAINPIFESDILDIRPFLQRTVDTKALEDHISAPTLAAAHPQSVITNSIINKTATILTAPATNTDTITVANSTPFNPTTLGYNPIVRLTNDFLTFTTAKVLSASGSNLVLDHQVSAANGTQVVLGEITLDRVTFDIVDQLSDVMERDFTTGTVQLKSTVSPSFTDVVISNSLVVSTTTADRLLGTNLSNEVSSVDLAGFITQTANQVLVSNDGNGGVILSLPQDIAVSSSPSFAGLTIGALTGVLKASSGTVSASNVNLTSEVTGTLPVSSGGTGATSFTAGQLLLGNGTSAISSIVVGSANVASTVVSRDGSGNFSAGTITATLSGTATNFSGSLSGDVTGNQSSTVVALVGGKTASTVASTVDGYNAATSSNTANTLVERDGSGNFSAGTITATLNGTATNVSGTVAIANGGTGATTALNARTNLGIVAGSATLSGGGTVVVALNASTDYAIAASYTAAGPTQLIEISKGPTSFTITGDPGFTVDYIAIKKA
jgi:hypothetical protein